jgi:hypothetical protein
LLVRQKRCCYFVPHRHRVRFGQALEYASATPAVEELFGEFGAETELDGAQERL